MATLEKQAIRAKILIGSSLEIRTPDVVSFNVQRSRGQMAATFSASVKVPYDQITSATVYTESEIVIQAGRSTSFSNLDTIFTGIIYKAVINPVRTDASKLMLNLNGRDTLSVLEGQKINRRLTTTYKSESAVQERWGIVNNIVKQNTPTRQQFQQKAYTKNPMAVIDWKGTHHITTPDAYRLETNPNRKREAEIKGGLVAEKVVGEG
ncbi:MAG: hypothetical protein ACXACY_19860 [Candidatus Hodarchaeales archaeon]|jgi:hypothetical protein